MNLLEKASGLALGWVVLAAFWLLTVAALIWGRQVLSREEIGRALRRTAVWSVAILFPLAWVGFSYCAQFNPRPTVTATYMGGLMALLFLPVYSALVACAAFESEIQKAARRGSPRRPPSIRVLASVVLLVVALGELGLLVAGAMLAAGPRLMG